MNEDMVVDAYSHYLTLYLWLCQMVASFLTLSVCARGEQRRSVENETENRHDRLYEKTGRGNRNLHS